MSKIIQVERSIHYSMHDYHGKADFEKLTPMFLGYKIKHKLGLTGPFKRFNYVIHFLKKGNDIFIESGTQHNLVAGTRTSLNRTFQRTIFTKTLKSSTRG